MLFASNSLEPIKHRNWDERRASLQAIIQDFATAFPDLEFEVETHSPTINAQAIFRGNRRLVRIYGGLAFHPLVGSDVLVFALLHEVGHHLSSGGRYAFCKDLGCECAADRWALTKGVSRLKTVRRVLQMTKAIEGLDSLNSGTVNPPSAQTTETSKEGSPEVCWALNWGKRKLHLAGVMPMPVIRRCYLSDFYVS